MAESHRGHRLLPLGLGEYLARLTPLTPLTGALVGGVVLVGLNVIRARLAGGDYDLVIIGASREWAIGNVLFGAIPDVIADRADCSVLMIRRARPERWAFRLSEGVKRMKEFAGLTTSPEESGAPAAPPPAGDS